MTPAATGAYGRLVDALRSHGSTGRADDRQAMLQCPAHEDRNPSLSVTATEGRVLIYCHGGCPVDDVLVALELSKADLFDEPRGVTYRYDDGRQVRRSPEKRFSQAGNTTGRPQLYRLSKVRQAVAEGRTVYLVEGEQDVHALEAAGVTATTAPMGSANFGKVDISPLAGADVVAIVDRDDAGHRWAADVDRALAGVVQSLTFRRAAVGKDAADHVAAGLALDEIQPCDPLSIMDTEPCTLSEAHAVFARWLGDEYDQDALDAVLAAAACERLTGDPVWLLLVSGSGNAKTETVQALDGIGATITSTISSPGALLSATSRRERSSDATGGLLRKLGARGVLVVKGVTSILSTSRDSRAEVLAALREVYDGRWSRNVGTDGGRTLDWTGRLVCIGAVTTAWDRAHDVIASMGDRFVLVRMDSTTGRQAAGRRAISNTGDEIQMRRELAAAAAGVLAGMDTSGTALAEAETSALLAAADLVTLARTGVDFDYRGDVIDCHAPEMPTRFAKQLTQMIRGAVAVGVERPAAVRLAIRCARDSMPPLRLAIVDDLAANPGSTATDVRRRLNKPRATVDRQLQALHMLGVLDVAEEETELGGKHVTRWYYTIAASVDPHSLDPDSLPDLALPAHKNTEKRVEQVRPDLAISGNGQIPGPPALPGSDRSQRQRGVSSLQRCDPNSDASQAVRSRPTWTDG